MIIQNEFCNGGNLSSIISHNRKEGSKFTEGELKRLTRHVALVSHREGVCVCVRVCVYVGWVGGCVKSHPTTHVHPSLPLLSPQGLQHIHSLGLVHLDIKPENIFVSLPDQRLTLTSVAESEEMAVDERAQLLYKIGKFV